MKHSRKSGIKEVIIIGPSGSGKGTQAKLIAEKFGWQHITVGKIFRKEVEQGTNYGKKVAVYMEQGKWVPTKLVFEGLVPILAGLDYQEFILDGFPRVPDQPKALDDLMKSKGKDIDLVIHLSLRPEVIMARRMRAWKKGKSFYQDKRKDETEEAIKGRLKSYQETIEPILDYYQKKGVLAEVDGEQSIEDVFSNITGLIEARFRKDG